MKPEIVFELLGKYVKGQTLLRHCKTVGVAMRYFAEKYGEDADYWESVGILHDIDFEVAPDAHCTKCVEIFAAGCSRDVIRTGTELMGVELNEIIQDCILAMRTKHEEIGC